MIINIVVLVLFLISFPIAEGYRDYLSFPIPLKVSKLWHGLGFTIRAFVAILLLLQYWIFIPFYGFYFWTAFDLTIFIKTKKQGTTAATDKFFKKHGIVIKITGLILSYIFICYGQG